MKRLVYTAGPITGCNYLEAIDWRETVRKELALASISTISPMRGKQQLNTEEENIFSLSKDLTDPLSTSSGVNTRDYNDVRRADLIFVNVLGAKTVSIGTVMEVAWARAFNKPIVLVMEKKGNVHDHWMFTFPCGFIVSTLEKGIEIAKHVLLTDDEILENSNLKVSNNKIINAQIGCGNGKCETKPKPKPKLNEKEKEKRKSFKNKVKGKFKIERQSNGFYEIIQMFSNLNSDSHMLVGSAATFNDAKIKIINLYNNGVLQYVLVDNVEYYYVVQ